MPKGSPGKTLKRSVTSTSLHTPTSLSSTQEAHSPAFMGGCPARWHQSTRVCVSAPDSEAHLGGATGITAASGT